ncbi:hypothetical protein L3X38_042246 [Prunus dulcis]|uniref:Uncharacterized protein n=1 Tax=Prunus dulcis TaxID=3755 RepID=A0AAD4YK53_PRUDU|nr:hypothetical protein L3X38_042246 [Prunus dulcis]
MKVNLEVAIQAARDAEAVKGAVEVALEEMEWSKAAEADIAEVGLEMANLVYRFKPFNPLVKLNLNFAVDPPPLPEGVTEEMIEDYEGEGARKTDTADPAENNAAA